MIRISPGERPSVRLTRQDSRGFETHRAHRVTCSFAGIVSWARQPKTNGPVACPDWNTEHRAGEGLAGQSLPRCCPRCSPARFGDGEHRYGTARRSDQETQQNDTDVILHRGSLPVDEDKGPGGTNQWRTTPQHATEEQFNVWVRRGSRGAICVHYL